MKRLVISHFELVEMNKFEFQDKLSDKLKEAGFDLSKPIQNLPNTIKAETIFTQED